MTHEKPPVSTQETGGFCFRMSGVLCPGRRETGIQGYGGTSSMLLVLQPLSP